MTNALVWVAVVVLGLCVATWAKYAIDRNSTDEVGSRLDRPLMLTGLLVALVVTVSALS